MQTYHVVSGTKVTKSASAMLAEFNEKGGRHYVMQYDPDAVCIEFEYNGSSVPVTITWEDAQKEKMARLNDEIRKLGEQLQDKD